MSDPAPEMPELPSQAGVDQRFAKAYALQDEGRFHRAARAYQGVLALDPNRAPAWNNLGNCLRSIGEFEQSLVCFNNALALEPGRASSRLNRALANLALGRYGTAWPDYEARLETIEFRRDLLSHPERRWDGSPLGGDEILYLFGNQGLGDELQCLRFVPELASRVSRVVLELQRPVAPLAGGLPPGVEVIERGDPVPPFHRWCEIFSLPGLLGIEPGTIPPPVPPEFPGRARVRDAIRARFGREGLRVGLVWSGNPDNSLNRVRACGLGHLEPLLEIGSCGFCSLQKGLPATEIRTRGLSETVLDLDPLLGDLADTATAITELDLVITTDTSVPHLAGILGVEAWVLLQRPADWRWGQDGDRTPWYPSLRLYRQERMREWEPVVRRVRDDLASRCGQ